MRLRPVAATVLLLVCALVAPAAASTGRPGAGAIAGAQPAPGPRGIVDAEAVQVVCEGSEIDGNGQLTGPDQLSTAHLLGTPERISLDVLLVLDLAEAADVARIDRSTPEGEAAYQAAGDALFQQVVDLLEVAPQPYEPLGIDLVWAGWDLLQPLEAGAPRVRTTESQAIIDLARAQYGGARPEGADVVYVATDLDIQALGQTAVAGQADCIGGVGDPAHAFAVGEVGDALVHPKDGIPIGPVTFYRDFAAKVAAHEIGHLMGGHHHYQECATPGPVTTAVDRAEIGACTLMSNAVDFQTLPFSTLNGAVVRGHAEAYATP